MNPPQLSFTGHNVQLRHEYTAAGQLVPYFFQENRAVFQDIRSRKEMGVPDGKTALRLMPSSRNRLLSACVRVRDLSYLHSKIPL